MIAYTKLRAKDRSVALTLMTIYPTDRAKSLMQQLDWHRDPESQEHYCEELHKVIRNFSEDLVKRGEIDAQYSDWKKQVEAAVTFALIRDQIRYQSAIFTKVVRPIHYLRFHKHVTETTGKEFKQQSRLDLLEQKELIRILQTSDTDTLHFA